MNRPILPPNHRILEKRIARRSFPSRHFSDTLYHFFDQDRIMPISPTVTPRKPYLTVLPALLGARRTAPLHPIRANQAGRLIVLTVHDMSDVSIDASPFPLRTVETAQ
jgi:hypothetical protein